MTIILDCSRSIYDFVEKIWQIYVFKTGRNCMLNQIEFIKSILIHNYLKTNQAIILIFHEIGSVITNLHTILV